MYKVTFTQIQSALNKVVNALRGSAETTEFKQYIFPLLFFKRLSDQWDLEYKSAVEEHGEDEADYVMSETATFKIPDGCHWMDIMAVSSKRGVALKKAFKAIEDVNPEIAGVFPQSTPWEDEAKLPNAKLEEAMNAFHEITLNVETVETDVLGDAYEWLLKYFADESGKKAGEFYTPRGVVQLLVRLLHPKGKETIMDPTCGSGGMLIEAAREVERMGGKAESLQFFGQELMVTTSAIARMNLLLHGLERVQIEQGDTLAGSKIVTEKGNPRKVSVTLANPPFSVSSWDRGAWEVDPRNKYGTPPQSAADWAFVQHMLAHMNPRGGRVGVVLPHGVLFRNGGEGAIREAILRDDKLDAVIGLPSNLFFNTGIPACILIFRAEKTEERKNKVLFVDAQLKFAAGKNQNILTEQDVTDIVSAFDTGEDPDGDGGIEMRLVDFEEIAKNKFDISISKYVSAIKGEEVLPFAEAQQILSTAAEARKSSEDVFLAALKDAGYEL